MLKVITGDLFKQEADAIVNAVNCVGVMGGGIALAFKQRYPAMFEDYTRACKAGTLRPGTLHVYGGAPGPLIINFPTKDDFRNPSRIQYVADGLEALEVLAAKRDLRSIAMPALGCGLGGLQLAQVRSLMEATALNMPATILTLVLSKGERHR